MIELVLIDLPEILCDIKNIEYECIAKYEVIKYFDVKKFSVYGIAKNPSRIFIDIYNNNEWGIVIKGDSLYGSKIEFGIGEGYPYITICDDKVYNFISTQLHEEYEYTDILLPNFIDWAKDKLD